nr:uncharacterized protein LOC129469659 [Symphalangus syndactylus]
MKLAQSLGAGNWQSWNLNLNSLTPPPQKGAEFSKGIPRVRPKATMNLIHRVSPVHKPLWLHDSIGPHNYLMRVVLCDSSPHSPREDTNHQRESELELDDKYGPLPPQPWTWGMTSPLPEEDGSWWMLRLTVDPPRLHGCSRLQPPAGLFHGSLHLKMHRIRMRVFKLSPLAHSRLPGAKAQTPLAPSPDAAKRFCKPSWKLSVRLALCLVLWEHKGKRSRRLTSRSLHPAGPSRILAAEKQSKGTNSSQGFFTCK